MSVSESESDTECQQIDEYLIKLKELIEPEEEVRRLWKLTHHARMNMLNSNNKYLLSEYLDEFKILSDSRGILLLVDDGKITREINYRSNKVFMMSSITPKLIRMIKDKLQKPPTQIASVVDMLKENNTLTPNIYHTIALICLPYIFTPTKYGVKETNQYNVSIKPSTVEMAKFFLPLCKTAQDFLSFTEDIESNVFYRAGTLEKLYPIISVVGNIENQVIIIKFYKTTRTFRNIEQAFDALFNIYFGTCLEYPLPAHHIYLFLQQTVLEIQSGGNGKGQSLLKFKESFNTVPECLAAKAIVAPELASDDSEMETNQVDDNNSNN